MCAGLILAGLLGCKHPPELKPPEQAEVLACPGDKDKRYEMPCSYPPEVLATDPNKKDGILPAGGKNGAGTSMSPASMGMAGRGY
jgi:hypothetical protein